VKPPGSKPKRTAGELRELVQLHLGASLKQLQAQADVEVIVVIADRTNLTGGVVGVGGSIRQPAVAYRMLAQAAYDLRPQADDWSDQARAPLFSSAALITTRKPE
jgi:hypothetical protein